MRTKQFKAESKKLLDMMINSIYTHKAVSYTHLYLLFFRKDCNIELQRKLLSGGYHMGKFVMKETKNGVKCDLKAGNGEVIATSEVYSGDAACKDVYKRQCWSRPRPPPTAWGSPAASIPL